VRARTGCYKIGAKGAFAGCGITYSMRTCLLGLGVKRMKREKINLLYNGLKYLEKKKKLFRKNLLSHARVHCSGHTSRDVLRAQKKGTTYF